MVVHEHLPLPENRVLRDLEQALKEFKDFDISAAQRQRLVEYLASRIEARIVLEVKKPEEAK